MRLRLLFSARGQEIFFFPWGIATTPQVQRRLPQSVSPQQHSSGHCRGVTEYNSTATAALCAPSPHLSHDYRPNRDVAAHIPTPAPIAAHPTRPRLSPQRFKTARPSPRLTPCAQSPLLLFAGTCSQLPPARPRSRLGGTLRHPCLR